VISAVFTRGHAAITHTRFVRTKTEYTPNDTRLSGSEKVHRPTTNELFVSKRK
jgi:hypothetical protein